MKRILLVIVSLCFMRPLFCKLPAAETIDRLQELQRCISTIKSNVQTIEAIVIQNEDISEEVSLLGEILCSKLDNITVSVSAADITVDFGPVLDEISLVGDLLCTKIEELSDQVSFNDALILTAIDNITVPPVTVSGIDELSTQLSLVSETLCSKIEDLSDQVSSNDALILTAIDNITVPPVTVSGIEELSTQLSLVSETLCTKIEELSDQVSLNDALILTSIDNITVSVATTSELEELFSAQDILICSKIGGFDDEGSCLDSQIDIPQDIDNLNLNVIQLLKTILLELRGCNVP